MWASNTTCGRDVVDLQCCRMSGVASHESKSQSCSQGLATRSLGGCKSLCTAAICTSAIWTSTAYSMSCVSEVFFRRACRLSRHGSCAHGDRERTVDADRFGHTACVPGGATGQCASPGRRSGVHLVRGEAFGAGEVTAGEANHQAPAAGLEAKNVHNTKKAVATSHALPSPMDQAT